MSTTQGRIPAAVGPEFIAASTPTVAEPHWALGAKLNWLRAAVLGANDGIVSTAGLVMGVAGATTDRSTILVAGLAGLVAGALSMGGGEYVSVSTQRDTERAALDLERGELAIDPDGELAELATHYRAKGLSEDLSQRVAEELTRHDALAAHAEVELHLDPDEHTNPWHAAWASMVAFTLGAALPLLAILAPPDQWRASVTVGSVLLALALTGAVSARLGSARPLPAVLRNVLVGALSMGLTYAIGSLVGGAV